MINKREKGITLIILIITIIIMTILLSVTTVEINDFEKRKKLGKMYNDIDAVKESIELYYLKHNALPIGEEVNDLDNISAYERNENDGEKYYYINLSALSNLSLSLGEQTYIINEKTHEIYNLSGVTINSKTYHRKHENNENM